VFGIVSVQLLFTVGIACIFLFNSTLKVRIGVTTDSICFLQLRTRLSGLHPSTCGAAAVHQQT
jgi:hypothetical protein